MTNDSNNVRSLGIARAEEAEDCRLCTSLEVLEELVADIKRGELEMPDLLFVAMCVKPKEDESGNIVGYCFRCAGGRKSDLVGLLSIHLHKMLDDC